MQKVEGSNPFSRSLRHVLTVIAVVALASLGGMADAAARGTASSNGPTLSYTGDDAPEKMSIDKMPVYDGTTGNIVGAYYVVVDVHPGGAVTASPPCEQEFSRGARCPLGSSTLEVNLAGGPDSFQTSDRTLGRGFGHDDESCNPVQATAAVRLDGGAGGDLIQGSRLGDTLAGGPGRDFISGWDGNDHLTGGPGVDLLEGHDGEDVAEGGPGNDVISLDANPLDRESCFRPSGRPYKDVGRGGPGSDSISGQGGDRLEGGPGNDGLGATGGRNKLLGGAGRDTIWSRDGRRDYVNCGSGIDLLEASDRSDRVVGCEKRFLRPR